MREYIRKLKFCSSRLSLVSTPTTAGIYEPLCINNPTPIPDPLHLCLSPQGHLASSLLNSPLLLLLKDFGQS